MQTSGEGDVGLMENALETSCPIAIVADRVPVAGAGGWPPGFHVLSDAVREAGMVFYFGPRNMQLHVPGSWGMPIV